MKKIARALSVILISLPALAAAEEPFIVPVAGKNVVLAVPHKLCAYEAGQKADADVLLGITKANPRSTLLLAFTDCDDLKVVREAKDAEPVDGYYGQVSSDIAGQSIADNYTRASYVKALATQYAGVSPDKAMAEGEEKLKTLMAGGLPTGRYETIGLIRHDSDFLQIGMLGSQASSGGGVRKTIQVLTVTKLGVPVSITFDHPATQGISLRDVSDNAALYARQLITLNPETEKPFAHGVELWSALAGFAGGMVLMGLAQLLIFFARKRR